MRRWLYACHTSIPGPATGIYDTANNNGSTVVRSLRRVEKSARNNMNIQCVWSVTASQALPVPLHNRIQQSCS